MTESMLAVAGELESCEELRATLLAEIGQEGASLKELVAVAEDEGIDGFSLRGDRLTGAVGQLQELQEQNARLIISASNLRERWLGMLTRLASPTYNQRGHEPSAGARLVSRSA
ncbi:MAG: flagellar export chaperone FlgN [Dehalococcoidia bacterium]|nr:flagellar export chaperone FlgN [Dehalococcoidia bacterium]